MISLISAGSPAEPAAYTSIPTNAHARRPRYGRAYSNRRWSGRVLLIAIPMRMRAMPLPGRANDRLEIGEARRPVELRLRLLRSGVQHGRVAGTARRQRPRNLSTRDAF